MKLPIPRDAILLALSQAARVLGPGLAMVVLAAKWEPETFGEFASHFALASLVAFLPAAGLSAFILDRGGREPASLRATLRSCDRLLAATLALPLLAGLIAFAFDSDRTTIPVTLYIAMTLAAFVELRVSAFRATKQEKQVFPFILIANGIIILAALLPGLDSWAVGLFWAMARGFQLVVLTIRAGKAFPQTEARLAQTAAILPFIASQSAGVFYTHLDTLLVRAFLGEAAAGLYNAALRLLQLASMAAQTLSQWFQPRLAAQEPDSAGWLRQRRILRLLLAVSAVGGLLAFTLLGGFIIRLLYGEAYAEAAPILFLAGFVLAARCFVAGQWMELTARQLESHRARDSWLLLAVFAAIAWLLAPAQGGSGVMLAHLLALAPIAAFSARSLARAAPRSKRLN